MSWLSTTPESLKLKVWSKSLATRKCTGSFVVVMSLLRSYTKPPEREHSNFIVV
jgi:hypothetical protein